MTDSEHGYKWWLRYVIVPIIGSGGIIALLIAVIGRPAPEPPSLPAAIPSSVSQSAVPTATVSVTNVTLGSHLDSQFRTPVPKEIFKPTDTIVVHITTNATGDEPVTGTIGVLLTYGEGDALQAVADDSREIVFNGDGQTAFHFSKPDTWPAGLYQAEVFLNGSSVNKTSLTVR